jgi:hypothetical protein
MTNTVTARDVPEIRARMARWARDSGLDGASNWFTFFLGPRPNHATETRVFNRSDDVGGLIASTLAVQLPAAELFYVSSDMTRLARHAADTLTDYRLHADDLPAPIGLLVYAEPPVDNTESDRSQGITMISWGPGRGGLWVHTWAAVTESWTSGVVRLGRALAELPHEETLTRATRAARQSITEPTADNPPTTETAADWFLAALAPNLQRTRIPPSFAPPHGHHWHGLTPMQFTDMHGWPTGTPHSNASLDPDTQIALERTILATWLLMGQTLTRSEIHTAPRPARRRIARDDPKLDPTVRYIDLRRSSTEPGDTDTTEPHSATREYRHRWIVRGHWRNQYYPSRDDHRPIWIDPHFAGPEDKPLLGGERVNVLRR